MLATLFLVSILTFVALYLIPGDPALLILGAEADPKPWTWCGNNWGLTNPSLCSTHLAEVSCAAISAIHHL